MAKFLATPAGDDLWELVLLAGSLDARVDAAVGAQEPAFLARYAFELAQAFNVFYHKHHILSEEDAEKRAFLLRLTSLVREQLVTALGLLGISRPGENVDCSDRVATSSARNPRSSGWRRPWALRQPRTPFVDPARGSDVEVDPRRVLRRIP